MPSTYSESLRIELIAAGEQAGTWNITTNRNLGEIIEQGITGVGVINVTSGDRTLLALNAAVDEARNAVVVFTGIPEDDYTITVPNVNKEYTFKNDTDKVAHILAESGTDTFECAPHSISYVFVDGGSATVRGMSVLDSIASALGKATSREVVLAMGAAPLESPEFTGNPQADTRPVGDKSKSLATTEFVINNGVPKGTIVMWHGAAIPNGWYECNGENGTPDMRGMFALGRSSTYPLNGTGGSANAVLVSHNHGGITGSQNRNHTHSGSTSNAGAHTHGYVDRYSNPNVGGWGHSGSSGQLVSASVTTASSGAHTHTFTTGANSVNHEHAIPAQGESGTGKNMPPYRTIIFIMKG